MKTYKFAVSLCGGWCCGHLEFDAENEDEACEKAMDYVAQKLNEAFPTLGIDYNIECDNPDECEPAKCPECGATLICMSAIGSDKSYTGLTERLYHCHGCLSSWNESTNETTGETKFERYFFG